MSRSRLPAVRVASRSCVETLEHRIQFAATYGAADLGDSIDSQKAFINESGDFITFLGNRYLDGQLVSLDDALGASVNGLGMADDGTALVQITGSSGSVAAGHYLVAPDNTLTSVRSLPNVPGNVLGIDAMNASGMIAGTFYAGLGDTRVYRYADGVFENLGHVSTGAKVHAISDDGRVAGTAIVGSTIQPFRYDDVNLLTYLDNLTGQELTTGYGGWPNSINDDGVVVGYRKNADTNMNQGMIDVGDGMAFMPSPGSFSSLLYDVNNQGVAVGTRQETGAVVVADGVTSDLNTLTNLPAWSLSFAMAVNDAGQILAYGLNKGAATAHLFLLTPGGQNTGGGATDTASVDASIDASAFEGAVLPGAKGKVTFTVFNNASDPTQSVSTVTLYLSEDGVVSSDDIAVFETTVKIKLAGGATKTYNQKVTVPATLGARSLYFLGKITPVSGDTTAIKTEPFVASAVTTIVTEFGSVNDQRNVKLSRADADGTQITYKLSGPGNGVWSTDDDGRYDLTLTGTTAASKLVISSKGGDGQSILDDIHVNGPLGSLSATRTTITGDVSISGGVGSVAIAGLQGSQVALGGDTAAKLKFNQVTGSQLSVGGVKSLLVTGPLSGDSLIVSSIFPRKVKIDGASLDPSGDPRFTTPD